MLYVLIEAQKALLDRVQKEKELAKGETRVISEDRRGLETEQSGLCSLRPPLTKEPVSSLSESQVYDSEWLVSNPQERLAWAKASRDSRIAEGQQSPLEKRILSLGGVHTTAARHLVTQKCQEARKALCREQARSLDYWLAKAESYYNKKIVEMMKSEVKGGKTKTKVEEATPPSTEEPKQHYLVPKREKKQIEKHILRTGQARDFKSKAGTQPRLLGEITLPKIVQEKCGSPKAQRRTQVNERELLQIKDHRERMVRGRELLEQRLKERILRKSYSQVLLPKRRHCRKKEMREFERVVAYPLFQPSSTSRIKVDILIEKSQDEEDVRTIIKPCGRRFLAVPPFLRTQIGKIKD
ncbi:putative uncharacterized protein ZNRD1-AS1 [Acomys russatus]|uniref:putative uncharacterized protein ZNRD1-AS1 n=1 Tax=Acomys russatus TaxID=60746 RepID=UPI0021E25BBA|nr:putative uncharacterized protein ZNRD1-AS1 [Acomys russatus]